MFWENGKQKQAKELYQQYIPYLAEGEDIQLSAAGWTKLIHTLFDDVIGKEFQMVPIRDRCWADNYQDGRRRVLSLFPINDMYATWKWGWNFAYIPRASSNSAVWCRTDKSIYTHTFEVAPEFVTSLGQGRENVVFGRNGMNLKNNYKGFDKLVQSHLNVWETLQVQMKEYYHTTSTYEGMLWRITEKEKEAYYNFVIPQNPLIRAFIEKYLGNTEQAEKMFREILFDNDTIRDAYYEKFCKMQE